MQTVHEVNSIRLLLLWNLTVWKDSDMVFTVRTKPQVAGQRMTEGDTDQSDPSRWIVEGKGDLPSLVNRLHKTISGNQLLNESHWYQLADDDT